MTEHDTDWLKLKVAKLRLKPGDIVLVKTELQLNQEQVYALRERISETLRVQNEIVVLSWGIDVATLIESRTQDEMARILTEFRAALELLREKKNV